MLDAVIVGGGIAGLAAAWDLRNRDILVLEASDRLGGRIRSETRDPYWLNLGAHVFSGPGSATARLCADVGVEVASVPGQLAAVELNGRLVVGGRPELYPLRLPLTASERVALSKAGVRLRLAVARYRRAAAPREGESAPQARRRLLQFGDDQTFADWLGPMPGDADALFRTTVIRSTAEPEEISAGQGIGYFALVWAAGNGLSRNIVGGAGVLVDGIAAELGDKVATGCEATEVMLGADAVAISYTRDGVTEQVTARRAVVATRAFEAAAIVRGLPDDTQRALEAIPYGPTVVMAVLTDERGPMPWDDIYALATPKRSFNMLFNIANVAHARPGHRRSGGSLMMYRSAHGALPLLELPAGEVERAFLDDLYAIFPQARGHVRETQLLKLPRMLPYPAPGRAALQPALDRPLGRLHLAGDYLGGVYSDTAIASGQEAALAIRRSLA
ncbi:MAG TPA: FAD-dependent oxidoreductase [Gaiellales bacterium]|nr:FAD-dependent oxidoreductase [Gaiellales bacterium]